MLDERKEKMISLLLIGENKTVISKTVGVSRSTIYEWIENPEIKKELENRRKEIVTQGNNYVMANVQSHLEIIHGLAVATGDKRTSLAAAIYLTDRALGRTATKIEAVTINDKDRVGNDVLEAEMREWDENENN